MAGRRSEARWRARTRARTRFRPWACPVGGVGGVGVDVGVDVGGCPLGGTGWPQRNQKAAGPAAQSLLPACDAMRLRPVLPASAITGSFCYILSASIFASPVGRSFSFHRLTAFLPVYGCGAAAGLAVTSHSQRPQVFGWSPRNSSLHFISQTFTTRPIRSPDNLAARHCSTRGLSSVGPDKTARDQPCFSEPLVHHL